MTTKIIPFPKKLEPELVDIEKVIIKWLSIVSTDEALKKHVLQRTMGFIEQYASKYFEPIFDLAIPSDLPKEQTEALLRSIEKGVDATAMQVQEVISRIIVERFLLEIELYEKHTTDNPSLH